MAHAQAYLTDPFLQRRWHGFGTSAELTLWHDPAATGAAHRAAAHAVAYLRRAEQRLSRFLPDSELARLNRRAGEAVRVSPLLYRLLAAALAAARATDGLFDPTVQPALLAAGYTRNFRDLAGGQPELPPTGARPGCFRAVRLHRGRHTVTLPPGAGIDLGGIAKGWLADDVLRRLQRLGPALVDLGGDCAFSRPAPDAPWELEVVDPWQPARTLATFTARDAGGVATSGVVRRRWQTGATWQHHLIDPRSGRPATTDLAAVTVLGPNATTAEVLAKAVLLLGREQGRVVLERWPACPALLVAHDGRIETIGSGWQLRHPSLECAS